jgi:NAD(P)-dependent dehydrogenase (short-subunit alcohol dehydrogenase family)
MWSGVKLSMRSLISWGLLEVSLVFAELLKSLKSIERGGDIMRLKDKVAIVTGASKGIGKGIAEVFAKEGANLVITGLSDMEGLEDTHAKIVGLGGKALKLQIDMSKLDDIDKLVSTTINEFGHVDILVNNAAVLYFKFVTDLSEEEWDRTMDTNIKGPYFATQKVVPHMKKQGKGKIVHIASTAGFRAINQQFSSYAISKGGVVQMAKSMAIELAQFHINVNAIAPGPINTPMNLPIFSDPERVKWFMERLPSKRFGEVEDIANAAVFLASDEADWVHGATLLVDGGWTSY